MTILIFNWRDIKNPAGGGAELLTHELAERWVKSGHKVIQFCSMFPNAKKKEEIDGVTFIRKGKWWTVHLHGFFYYLQNKKSIDVIVDEVHWFPFFSAVYAKKKTIALTCEVATKLLFQIMPYPLAVIFATIEKIYLVLYKNVPTMVISPSTRGDLIAAGHAKENIVVIPMGLTMPQKIKIENKENAPTTISVGRLNKQKGTLALIDAFASVHKALPVAKLWLVGSGDQEFNMLVKNKINALKLEKAVTMWGFVSEEKKFSLMSKAHLLISASAQEGWGLTIPEAGMVRTPAVVYNIPGFRDIIETNKDGILVNPNPADLAKEIIRVFESKTLYKTLQVNAEKKAHSYSWDRTANEAIAFIKSSLKTLH